MSDDDQLKPDILCFSSSDWEGAWGSRQQVMLRFAKLGYRVLYVEQLAGLEHWFRHPDLRQRRKQQHGTGVRKVDPNLWIVTPPWLLPGRYYTHAINQVNGWIIKKWIRPILAQMNFVQPLLWLYKPEHTILTGQFHEKLCIYHCIDEWTVGTRGRKKKVISDLEESLLTHASLVFANSQPTFNNKRRLNSNTYRIPSGVDVDLFKQALDQSTPVHPSLQSIPLPRIGYCGSINERLDYPLLESVVQRYPQYSFVFVGDTYPWPPNAPLLEILKSYPNVYFTGKFPFFEMPSLLKGFQVCLLPYVNDERGFYRSPLKLYEYMAAGKPVVSTKNPEACEANQVVYIASSKENFIQLIQHALEQDNASAQEQRIEFAKQNSWDRRVDQMEALIIQAITKRQGLTHDLR